VQSWRDNNWANIDNRIRTYDENNNTTVAKYWVWEDDEWKQGTDNITLYYNNMHSNISIHGHKCTTTYIKIANPNGITETDNASLRVYPNPATGQLIIENEQLIIRNVELFDMMGKLVMSPMSHKFQEMTINISHLPSGIYFVRVSTEAGKIVKKVLKE